MKLIWALPALALLAVLPGVQAGDITPLGTVCEPQGISCPPPARFRVCYQTVWEDRTATCFKPVYTMGRG